MYLHTHPIIFSRAPRGARGLKFRVLWPIKIMFSRAPRGARGLKYGDDVYVDIYYTSCPSRGTWIEIAAELNYTAALGVVPLAGHVD